ncbi:MAG: hypothetical protein ACK53A_02645 [Gemmatimonadota bacterium]|jgi:hypothetical protein|nr:hypothetical protein [Gemmatimonadota bacterium]
MGTFSLILVCGIVFFYRVADYERLSGWLWGVASAALTVALSLMGAGTGTLILGQVALFVVLWGVNTRRRR